MIKRLGCLLFVAFTCVRLAHAQFAECPVEAQTSSQANLPAAAAKNQESSGSTDSEQPATFGDDQGEVPKRILGMIPNYRTTQSLRDYRPITPKEKFVIASQDSFDRGAVILGALFGAEAYWTKSTQSFGQGGSGYARYFATSYSDFVIGNFMTEAIYPTIFHQDPRYFRRASGSGWSRLGSAAGQIFWTRTDSGRSQFNFSEIIGSSTGVAISNAYYPDKRNASDALTRFGIQISVDLAGNILKEFSPEISRLFSRKHGVKEASK
jgi:hypothetical protein